MHGNSFFANFGSAVSHSSWFIWIVLHSLDSESCWGNEVLIGCHAASFFVLSAFVLRWNKFVLFLIHHVVSFRQSSFNSIINRSFNFGYSSSSSCLSNLHSRCCLNASILLSFTLQLPTFQRDYLLSSHQKSSKRFQRRWPLSWRFLWWSSVSRKIHESLLFWKAYLLTSSKTFSATSIRHTGKLKFMKLDLLMEWKLY